MRIIKNRKSLFLFCAYLMTLQLGYAQNEWELKNYEDGIKVYTKKVEGSSFRRFKAVVTIDAPVAAILKILKDADNYVVWYGNTEISKLLKEEENVQFSYVETIFPWPYRNRDMIYRSFIDLSVTDTTKILLVGVPDYIPIKQGIVRMGKADGYFLLIPVGDKTKVIYSLHTEPGSNVPAWLVNIKIAELPFKTFVGLRKMAEDSK